VNVVCLFVAVAPSHAQTVRLHPTLDLVLRGIDQTDGVLLATRNETIYQSEDWSQTWNRKNSPTEVKTYQRSKMLRLGNRIYLAALSKANLLTIWSSPPAPGTSPFVWTKEFSAAPGSHVISTAFNSDSRFLYLGEYGDPVGGPSVYRSSGNGSWRRIFGPRGGWRHIHGVAPDPYAPGHVYMTMGDGVGAALFRADNYGDGNWTQLLPGQANGRVLQSVQLSFDADRIWLAADAARKKDGVVTGTTAFYLRRSDLIPRVASSDYHYRLPVPNKPQAHFKANAFWGAVDPNTGNYYAVTADASPAGTETGLFFLDELGGPLQVLDSSKAGLNGEVFIAHGEVWTGGRHLALLP
jgi:hypothetical protein